MNLALLWGTMMDAWINPDSLLKYRPEDLSEDNRDKWYALRRCGKSSAALASALQTALEKGHMDKGERQALDVKVGDRVLFAKYAGTEVKHDGVKYLIMRESDILAIVA